MKHTPRHLILAFACSLTATFAQAQTSKPVEIKDVPPATQQGTAKPTGGGKYSPPFPAKKNLPTLWLIGDSTVRNGSTGSNAPDGQWGWGAPITAFFNPTKINVVNRAFGGTSSRSFYRDAFWNDLKPLIKKGDFVIIQFGANDNGGAKGKGALSGTGDETAMNDSETVHTFGWYLAQFVSETRAQGATPIICSLTPRKGWNEDNTFKRAGAHAVWAEEIAKKTNTPFIPLSNLIAERYEKLGKEAVDSLYVPSPKENLHPGWEGAVINAECVISGLKALSANPLAAYFSPRADSIPAATKTTP
ncbi:MAG: rhamnogalacturonan acetylesterase [Luteolibacter sp.]